MTAYLEGTDHRKGAGLKVRDYLKRSSKSSCEDGDEGTQSVGKLKKGIRVRFVWMI